LIDYLANKMVTCQNDEQDYAFRMQEHLNESNVYRI
jgi:hypothetical protein